MIIYGLAAAVIGRNETVPNLVCSCLCSDSEKCAVKAGPILPDFTEQFQIDDRTQIRRVLDRLVATAHKAIVLQSRATDTEVPIVLGVDARRNFPIQMLLDELTNACFEYCRRNGIELNQILNRVHVTLGDFRAELCYSNGEVNGEPSIEDLVQWYLNEEPNLIEGYSSLNSVLKFHEAGIRIGEKQALVIGRCVAYSFGMHNLQKMMRVGADVSANFALYIPYDARLQKIPLYACLGWHPQLKDAYRAAVQLFMGEKRSVIIKTPFDKGCPPFVDVLKCKFDDLRSDCTAPMTNVVQRFIQKLKATN